MAEYFFDEESSNNDDDNTEGNNDIYNYKGYFVENEDEEKKFYEFGAHFSYISLYKKLEILAQQREKEQKELESKLKIKESREDPATNEESNTNDNLKDILSIFQQKGKSRNRGDISIGLTYMPQNKKNINNLNSNEVPGLNIIKSTSRQNPFENMNKNKLNKMNNKNKSNNIINIKINKNLSNKKNKNKNKSFNINNKVRKRNNQNIINVNNSINSNVIGVNIYNKIKYFEKTNLKNLTHDMPYISKIKDNLAKKLKSIQYSKEKLRKQIINTGKLEQKLTKVNKIKSKWSCSKFYGNQNKKNLSSSKNVLSKEKKSIKKINNNSCISSDKKKERKKSFINNNNLMYKSKSYKNANIQGNIQSIKDIYYKNNKNKLIFNGMISNKKFNNKNSQIKIPNNNNYKSLKDKINSKTSSNLKKKSFEFIENISKNKNISRNNNMQVYERSLNNTNKIFNSLNDISSNNNSKNNKNINFNTNLNNLTQQLKQEYSKKYKKHTHNPISFSKPSLYKHPNSKTSNKPKTATFKNKANLMDAQVKLKNYLNKNKELKSALNLKEKNINMNPKFTSLYKNNLFIKSSFNNGKNISMSRNRNENNDNSNNEKFTGRTNNSLIPNNKKNSMNINSNNQNLMVNKLNNEIKNDNSMHVCSVRSSDNQQLIDNNKNEKKRNKNKNKNEF